MKVGVNQVTLLGNLGADPEAGQTEGGASWCKLRVATTERWKGKDGQQQEKTEWHTVTCWNQLAAICAKNLAKGRNVYIEGSIQYRSWVGKDGDKRYSTEIAARKVIFLDSRGAASGEPPRAQPLVAAPEPEPANPWD